MAKVYVGTYAKYNNGSLAGKWIDLSQCATYDDFLAVCKETHKDEPDPEYMIQDTEDFPDGLSCMEWLSREDFDDVKAAEAETAETPAFEIVDYSERSIALIGDTKIIKDQLKAMGGRFNRGLSCGPGWIFSKSKEDALRAFLASGSIIPQSGNKNTSEDKETANNSRFVDWLKEFAEMSDDKDYYLRYYVGAIKIDDRYILLEKSSIENKFCFRDEGPDYDLYKKVTSSDKEMEKYFRDKNLRYLKKRIDEVRKSNCVVLDKSTYSDKRLCYYLPCEVRSEDWQKYETTSDKEIINLIIAGLQYAYDLFEKRINAYLKRYGVSKIHTWTYWAEA